MGLNETRLTPPWSKKTKSQEIAATGFWAEVVRQRSVGLPKIA
ncbi:MAG: hypothetical protein ACI96N_003215 [Arenicella sp.]|jgi:hypothetical protein